jgi:hypothetical protein
MARWQKFPFAMQSTAEVDINSKEKTQGKKGHLAMSFLT